MTAGALWILTQQLGWPVPVPAALAAAVAVALVVMPELRQCGGRFDKSGQLVDRHVATSRRRLHSLTRRWVSGRDRENVG